MLIWLKNMEHYELKTQKKVKIKIKIWKLYITMEKTIKTFGDIEI